MPTAPLAAAESTATPAADVALAKQAIDLVAARQDQRRDHGPEDASAIRSPASWSNGPSCAATRTTRGFDRLAAFSADNPSWPNATMIRRRAESALWDERRPAATVIAFFRTQKPMTAKGKFALARALLAQGDDAGAARSCAQAWREDTCSRDVERIVMETFGDMLTRADHKARMDRRFYDDDPDAGMRMAHAARRHRPADRQGAQGRGGEVLQRRAPCSRPCLPRARNDAGYIFHKAQWLRREDKAIEAARLLQSAPRSASQQHNLDEWWVERRLVARKLLDLRRAPGGLSCGARRAAAAKGEPARRARIHRRLDRAALHRQSAAPPSSTSPASGTAPPTRSRSRAASTGKAARSKPPAATARRARTIRPPRSIRPPITDRSRAPGSGWASSRCAARRSPVTAPR